MKLTTNARVLPALSSWPRNRHITADDSNASQSMNSEFFASRTRNGPGESWAASVSSIATSSAISTTMKTVAAAQKSGRYACVALFSDSAVELKPRAP